MLTNYKENNCNCSEETSNNKDVSGLDDNTEEIKNEFNFLNENHLPANGSSINKDLLKDITKNEKLVFKKNEVAWGAWFQASRPTFFVATLIPLLVSFVASYKYSGEKNWLVFVLIVLASFLVHLATNLANDIFEHYQNIDSKDGHIGGSRVLQENKLSLLSLAVVMLICYFVALIFAIVIVHISGQKILWVFILFAAISSIFYVAPPIKYGHRALGEFFVFINMGLIMVGAGYLALTSSFNYKIVALALPVSFMVASILYFQSLPEIETDKAVGKTTLANFLGKEKADFLFVIIWPFIWILMFNLYFSTLLSWHIFLSLISIPFYLVLVQKIYTVKFRLDLDKYGYLARILYLLNGIFLIVSIV